MSFPISDYNNLRYGTAGFHEQKRGLIAVWGSEAVKFLDGMITNDMKTFADGDEMLAAFPNAQGRLIAVVRVIRQGERFLFETEVATREKLFQNLFRFTFAGDFIVEDLSADYRYFELFNLSADGLTFRSGRSTGHFEPAETAEAFLNSLNDRDAVAVDDELFETLRIENGLPKYGVDIDETTIVPELGLDEMISYNKGCYIGQEIIARIHFRGHVAKRLTGIVSQTADFQQGDELVTSEGKNAGRVTSVSFSPKLEKTIALAFVRYDFVEEGTALMIGDTPVEVRNLPFG